MGEARDAGEQLLKIRFWLYLVLVSGCGQKLIFCEANLETWSITCKPAHNPENIVDENLIFCKVNLKT